MRTVPATAASLPEVAAVLNSGGVAVIPTDTVYGLAAHPAFPDAVKRLYSIKGRDDRKPIAMLAADAAAVERAGFALSAAASELSRKHWPGALTVVTGGEGFRVPDHPWTRDLLAACGGVLRVTSANFSGESAAVEVTRALAEVGADADIVVDGGVSPGGIASTVVRIKDDGGIEVLRRGAVAV